MYASIKMNAKTTYVMVAMPYMFARKWVVLRNKKYTLQHYKKDTVTKEILYTDKMIAASWSALVGIYLFPIYVMSDIRRLEETIRNIETEERVLTGFMDIFVE